MQKDENILFFNKLSLKEKISYALGDLASNLVFAALTSFIVIFWTDVAGIAVATTGIIILISKIWDGINDPIMGFIVDKTKSKHGKARAWLLWIPIPFAISAILAFCVPFDNAFLKIIYATGTYILVTTLYTAVNIPYGVLAAKMTTDQNERTSLNVFRMTFAISGMIFVTSLFIPLATKLGNGNMKTGISLTITIFSFISAILFFIVFKNCHEIVGNPATKKANDIKFSKALKSLLKNRAWIIELSINFLSWIGNGGRMAVTTYYAIYVVNDPKTIPLLMTGPLIGQVLGMISLTGVMTKKFGKVKTGVICSTLAGILNIMIIFVPDGNFSLVFTILLSAGFVGGPNMGIGFARLADTIEYGEYKTGLRIEGLTYAAGSMGGKLGSGIAGVMVGTILSLSGYIPNATQSISAIWGIKILMFVIPGLALIVIAITLSFSDLDKVYPDAIRTLARKRAEEYGSN